MSGSLQTYRPGDALPTGAAITIGNFDGLHRAHQAIIARVLSAARTVRGHDPELKQLRLAPPQGANGSCPRAAGLVTFDPSPLVVLHQEFPFILTPLEEKSERLAALGLDFLYLIPFDAALRRTPARTFMEQMILGPLKPSSIIVGPDHRFGSGREGDANLLAELKSTYGFELEIVPELKDDGAPIKSTRIRERLVMGAVRQAALLLGYRYRLTGRVVRGRGIGTGLGFPTINLELGSAEKLIPAAGVYAVYAAWDGERHPGAMNIGFRPTFEAAAPERMEPQRREGRTAQSLEVFLLDFEGQLYDRTARVEFVEYLRPERKFVSREELKAQIAADVATARLILAESR